MLLRSSAKPCFLACELNSNIFVFTWLEFGCYTTLNKKCNKKASLKHWSASSFSWLYLMLKTGQKEAEHNWQENRIWWMFQVVTPLHIWDKQGIYRQIKKNLLIVSLLISHVESNHLNTDICKIESSQEDESRAQSADFSKAYRKSRAFSCWWTLAMFSLVPLPLGCFLP